MISFLSLSCTELDCRDVIWDMRAGFWCNKSELLGWSRSCRLTMWSVAIMPLPFLFDALYLKSKLLTPASTVNEFGS